MTVSPRARALELFFIDGRPDGMLTAEVFNWTGHVLMAPRTQISDALRREQSRYTGVYLLIGERDDDPLVYVGEADDVSTRIRSHESQRDWWDKAIIITSTANTLNKAHVRYLESRLIEEARAVGKAGIENGTAPPRPRLSEPAIANMEVFLEYIMLVLPAIRIDFFLRSTRPESTRERPTERKVSSEPSNKEAEFELVRANLGLRATARLVDGEFVVDAGSIVRKDWIGAGAHGYRSLYEELVKTGVLKEQGDHRIFTENYAFRSPSAAAAVVNGRAANGTTEWVVKGEGKTYKRWEAEQLDDVQSEVSE